MVLNSLSERETCVQAASLAALTGPNSPVTLQALKSRALQLGANQEQVNELDSARDPKAAAVELVVASATDKPVGAAPTRAFVSSAEEQRDKLIELAATVNDVLATSLWGRSSFVDDISLLNVLARDGDVFGGTSTFHFGVLHKLDDVCDSESAALSSLRDNLAAGLGTSYHVSVDDSSLCVEARMETPACCESMHVHVHLHVLNDKNKVKRIHNGTSSTVELDLYLPLGSCRCANRQWSIPARARKMLECAQHNPRGVESYGRSEYSSLT